MSDSDIGAPARETVEAWVVAERSGDTEALGALLAGDFTGIGPHGYVLDKQRWLDRYDSGALRNEAFEVDEISIRSYGTAAVAVGVQTQQASYRGHPVDGEFRLSAVLIDGVDAWSIAHLQLSNIPIQ